MLSENMASLGGEQIISTKDSQDSTSQKDNNRPSSVERKLVRDREEKIRLTKERQNEERQRKIEELKAQAEAAQKYREQKEEERRRKIEELRNRDNDRRVQVEERKKAIMEAEKERREYILRKNQVERDARMDSKRRNERSSHVFAFGSSTPRLLDPAELGNISPSTYWGHRRSTSITNVAYTGAPLSRRSSERELADGSKKRATSAGGIDRQNDVHNRRPEDTTDSPPISYRSVARRKTDLMPTIPSPRESSFGSKTSLHSHTPRTPGSRSGDVTPGGSINTSRPGSAMSTSTTASGLVQRRSVGPVRKPRPASIAVTGVSLNDEINKHKKEKPPLPKLQSTPKRATNNSNSLSRSMITENGKLNERRSSAKKDVPAPKPRAIMQQSMDNVMLKTTTVTTETVVGPEKTQETKTTEITLTNDVPQTKEEKEALNAEKTDVINSIVVTEIVTSNTIDKKEENEQEEIKPVENIPEEKVDNDTEKDIVPKENSEPRELSVERNDNEMTASMIARNITTEEQAKAALAEKRRIMREEAERQAEIERQRVEAERLVEIQRQVEEEERQRKFEEETLRLAEEQKHAEEERLLQAIEEAKKREEADRMKREDEEKQKVEREEADKKAKEEAEKQRLEIAERLKKEEKEREERRKRVEAIMSRTRAKGGNSTPNSTPTKDNDNKTNDEKDEKIQEDEEKSTTDEILTSMEINQNNAQPDISVEETTECPAPQQEQQQQQQQHKQPQQQFSEQCSYEKTVTDKENALIKSFSNMIIDENSKNYQNFQNPFVQVANGKTLLEQNQSNEPVTHTIANGNGHIENLNKNDQLVDMSAAITDQLIDFNNESQQITDNVNFNNNSLSTTGTTLVTSDSHENKEISLL